MFNALPKKGLKKSVKFPSVSFEIIMPDPSRIASHVFSSSQIVSLGQSSHHRTKRLA